MTRSTAKQIALTVLNSIRRRPAYWASYCGHMLIIFEGWRSPHGKMLPKSCDEPITLEEYLERAEVSTRMPNEWI